MKILADAGIRATARNCADDDIYCDMQASTSSNTNAYRIIISSSLEAQSSQIELCRQCSEADLDPRRSNLESSILINEQNEKAFINRPSRARIDKIENIAETSAKSLSLHIPDETTNDEHSCIKRSNDDFEDWSTSAKKLIASFIILLMSWAISSYAVTIADERTPDPEKYKPLPDIFIDNINRITWAARASEITIVCLVLLFFIMLVFHKCRRLMIQRCLIMLSLLYLFRGLTICVTSMPIIGPHLTCTARKQFTIRDRLNRAKNVILTQGMEMYGNQMCGDYIYSGHTCMLVVLSHFLTEYLPRRFWMLSVPIWSICAFGAFCILAGHFHYTVDVVLAIVIASRLFVYYHIMCSCSQIFEPNLRKRFIHAIPLFYCFENERTCRQTLKYGKSLEIPPPITRLLSFFASKELYKDMINDWIPIITQLFNGYGRLVEKTSNERSNKKSTVAPSNIFAVRLQRTQLKKQTVITA